MLTSLELQNALVNNDFTKFNIETIQLMIRMFDTDKNGVIDFREFIRLWTYLENWKKVYHIIDADNSDSISYDEFNTALRSM